MARARNIKPGFFRNADLVELSFEARLLFIGLWTIADRDGRMEDRPKQIKMELFPADSVDVDALLNQLVAINMIERYSHEGQRVIQVVNFTKHQNPHRDEKASTLPDRDGNIAATKDTPKKHGANTVQAQCESGADTVAIGLIPESLLLNPDSLIPESGFLIASTEQAPVAVPAPEPKAIGVDFLVSQGCEASHAADWLKARKAKRAPLTATAWAGIVAEAAKAGMTPAQAVKTMAEKSWQGFNAAWLRPQERGSPVQTNPNDRNAEAARLLGFSTGDVIDA